MFKDIRNHYYRVINNDQKWSTNSQQFPGLQYIPYITELEEGIQPNLNNLYAFMKQKWHYSVYISIVYIIVILGLKQWMKTRDAYNLRLPMALWSTCLAFFSILGVIRCLPEFITILSTKGFTASFCDSSYYKVSKTFICLFYT